MVATLSARSATEADARNRWAVFPESAFCNSAFHSDVLLVMRVR